MEFESIRLFFKAGFAVCLVSLVLARTEVKPVSQSPGDLPTHGVAVNGYPGFTDQPRCPDGWYIYEPTMSCFRKPQVYHTLKHTAAQEFCRKEGGALATVSSQELAQVFSAHNMQVFNTNNGTLMSWVGYILIHNNNNESAWQVRTEEQTGPEPLIDTSANIPTTVPEELRQETVVCIQLKLVYGDGFLKQWAWNLATCDEKVPFICKKGASRSCFDRKGLLVPEGESYTPPGHDSCTVCMCLQGVPNICSISACAPPTCQNFQPDQEACCQYTCLDDDPNIPTNNDTPEVLMSENMRWVLTMITSFLLLGMMLFMVYRMRQKRIAYLRYRVQQLRDGQEGDFEPGSGPPPVPDDIDGAIFREPPPPYSFFKDENGIELPPPYHVPQNARSDSQRQDVNHNRDSRGSDQPDHVMLLAGSEPTTPSDITTISSLPSPPPYNRCQSSDSTPMTLPETTPMLGPLDTTQSSTSVPTLARNTTV